MELFPPWFRRVKQLQRPIYVKAMYKSPITPFVTIIGAHLVGSRVIFWRTESISGPRDNWTFWARDSKQEQVNGQHNQNNIQKVNNEINEQQVDKLKDNKYKKMKHHPSKVKP